VCCEGAARQGDNQTPGGGGRVEGRPRPGASIPRIRRALVKTTKKEEEEERRFILMTL